VNLGFLSSSLHSLYREETADEMRKERERKAREEAEKKKKVRESEAASEVASEKREAEDKKRKKRHSFLGVRGTVASSGVGGGESKKIEFSQLKEQDSRAKKAGAGRSTPNISAASVAAEKVETLPSATPVSKVSKENKFKSMGSLQMEPALPTAPIM
jgi:hypothetical protein